MNQIEYIKYYWKYIDDQTPVLIFAELDECRYAIRCAEVYCDRRITRQGEREEYVSEEPYPSNEEINAMNEFNISNISKDAFEEIWGRYPRKFCGSLTFPEP